eukprot:gene11714-34441_t
MGSDSDVEEGEIEVDPSNECDHKQRKLEREMRKRQKKQEKLQEANKRQKPNEGSNSISAGYCDIYGPNATAQVTIKELEKPIRLSDVQGLVLWVLGEYTSPRWVFLQNKPLIDRVVLVLANGVSAHTFKTKADLFPNLKLLGQPATVMGLSSTAKPSKSAFTA